MIIVNDISKRLTELYYEQDILFENSRIEFKSGNYKELRDISRQMNEVYAKIELLEMIQLN